MRPNSFRFVAFTVIVLGAHRLAPSRARIPLLLLASYLFYADSYLPHLSLLLFVTLTTFLGGRAVASQRKPGVLAVGVTATLLPLVVMKYGRFLTETLVDIGLRPPWAADWVLPIGISFYTFQAVSYLVDVYRGEIASESQLRSIALYLAFFPNKLAGPIERAPRLLPRLSVLRHPLGVNMYVGVKYVLWGMFCKLVVADNIARVVDGVLGAVSRQSGISLAVALLLFSFQIYFDFLGYTAIAIGVARLFNVRLSQNFRRPYASASLREFWRRWHITLSSWFRDYIYIPLGGSTTGGLSRIAQIMTVFIVSGLWHGAAWNFAAWGVVHGAGYCLEETVRGRGQALRVRGALRHAFQVAVTFGFVTLAWVFFRVSDFREIRLILTRVLFMTHDVPYLRLDDSLREPQTVYLILVLLSAVVLDSWRRVRVGLEIVPAARRHILLELAFVNWVVVSLVLLGDLGTRDFLYFRF